MRAIIFVVLSILSGHFLFAQELFRDHMYDQINRLTMTYADTLKTDVYYVPGKSGNERSPLILLVHGGGFYTGKRNGDLETAFAMDLAGRGYVVASMEYDLTRKGEKTGFGCDCPAPEKLETFRQAVVNIDQALDYLLKFSNEFHFDPDKIVLAGSSAGAESVLHAAYAGDHAAFQGVMDDNRKISAVISFAGALITEVHIDEQNAVPAFLVHGTDDKLVPYATAPHHYCREDAPGYLSLKGSSSLAGELRQNDASFVFLTSEGGGHEWANKAYELTEEISTFLYELLVQKKDRQVNRVISSKP